MTPGKVFGIFVRAVGLLLLIFSIWFLSYGLVSSYVSVDPDRGSLANYFISGAIFLLVSFYLLRGAPIVLRFSYPEEFGLTRTKET